MDANKLKKLREVGYKISKTCMWCSHRLFASETKKFGECMVHTYLHKKHTAQVCCMSINIFGSCGRWKPDLDKIYRVLGHSWLEFFEGDIPC